MKNGRIFILPLGQYSATSPHHHNFSNVYNIDRTLRAL